MADRNEERLLNELLAHMKAADAHLTAAHLEKRVVDAWAHGRSTNGESIKQDRRYARYAAGAVAASLFAAVVFWSSHAGQVDSVPQAPLPTLVSSRNFPVPTASVLVKESPLPARTAIRPAPHVQRTTSNSTHPEPELEFVALMPMTERELSGSFQIVRVQMPRASLGVFTSPLDDPHELVETDVLLGEDGMARAIRVSADSPRSYRRSR